MHRVRFDYDKNSMKFKIGNMVFKDLKITSIKAEGACIHSVENTLYFCFGEHSASTIRGNYKK